MLVRALIFALLTLPALGASPALAFSCRPYFAEQAFQDADASPDRYVVVHGRIDFNPADLPGGVSPQLQGVPADNFFGATVTGFSLTGTGFDARFVREIRVNAQCFGPWCASLKAGGDYLAFLKQQQDGYLLELSPCGGMAFGDPSERMLRKMHQCLLRGECEPPVPER